jgi:hypothetical protein
MTGSSVTYGLPQWTVTVHSTDPGAFTYLDSFHDRAADSARDCARVTAEPDPDARIPEFRFQQVRHRIRALWQDRLATTGTAVNLHAAAVDDGSTVLAFLGDRYHGKTTLLLDCLSRNVGGYLTNDNLIGYLDGDAVMLSTLPTYLKVRPGPAERFAGLLTVRSATSPHGAAMWRRYRRDPTAFPFHSDAMLPPAGFGVSRQPVTPLAMRRLVLVDVSFTAHRPAVPARRWTAAEKLALVTANLKWPALSEARGRSLAGRLADAAEVVEFRHVGDVAPLLDAIGLPVPAPAAARR